MTKMPDKRCGTCRWLHLYQDPVTGRYDRVDLNFGYTCDWPLPEMPVMAVCIDKPYRRRVSAHAGVNCPVWEPRPKASKPA